MAFLTNPDIDETIKCSGYLFWTPTNLSAEATWGTKLGFVEKGSLKFSPGYNTASITREEYGEAVYKKLYVGSTPRLVAVLRNWNATAMAVLFPGLNSTKALKIPSSLLTGTVISSTTYAKPLLFVPQDTTNNPCILLQQAAPNIVDSAKMMISHSGETLFPVVFDGIQKTADADGAAYFGLLSGATLR